MLKPLGWRRGQGEGEQGRGISENDRAKITLQLGTTLQGSDDNFSWHVFSLVQSATNPPLLTAGSPTGQGQGGEEGESERKSEKGEREERSTQVKDGR